MYVWSDTGYFYNCRSGPLFVMLIENSESLAMQAIGLKPMQECTKENTAMHAPTSRVTARSTGLN